MKQSSRLFAIKWLVVPSVLAVVGYFGIGPLLSGRAAPPPVDAEAAPSDPPRRFTTEPEVDVTASPAVRRARTPAPRREPERSRVKVVDPMPDSQTPDDIIQPPIPEPIDDHSTVPPITTTGGGDGTEDPPG